MTKTVPHDIKRTLIFLRRDNEILLALKKRGFGMGKWNGAGGKLEADETVEQALVRETEEEIGVTPLQYEKVAELDFIQDADTPDPWHMYVYVYLCNEWNGEPTESEEMAPRWYALDQIPYDNMWEDDRYWLPQVLAGERVTGVFTFDASDHMVTHDIRLADVEQPIIGVKARVEQIMANPQD